MAWEDVVVSVRPTGTVTFLFTDVVGSTAAWEADPQRMADALAVHDDVLRATFDQHGGYVFATGGDGFAVAFQRADDAVAAGIAGQRGLRDARWPQNSALSVRMGAHTGETVERDGDYFGPAVNRAARVMDAANDDQFVITAVTDALVSSNGTGVATRQLGPHRFKGLEGVVDVVEVVIDGRDDLGALRHGGGRVHGLPEHRTSFVGRAPELDELRSAIADHRLVTVVAPGGSGKTRLVSQVAHELAVDHPDGVWFVDLADVRNDEDLVAAMAAALDLGGALSDEDTVAALERWRAVLILDNCEQIIDGVAGFADSLLARCQTLTLLATSREALMIDGERVLTLPPLGGSGDGDEAVALFFARARLVAPDARPDRREVAELCDALDRLPLAIELAAARVDRMDIGEIAGSLMRGRADRRSRRRSGRHSDLRSVLGWSTDLLDDDERHLWRRLAVFDGGFSAAAVAAVAADADTAADVVDELLDSLVDRSLVVRYRTGSGMRHRLLVMARAVAHDELSAAGELEVTLDRHARWVEAWSSSVRAALSYGWLDDAGEVGNQRSALRHLIAGGELVRATQLLADAATPLVFGGHQAEVDELAVRLRADAPDDPVVGARLDEIDMIRAEWHGDFITSHQLADSLRSTDLDDRSWVIGTMIAAHHFTVVAPHMASVLIDELIDRVGADPRSTLLLAELALGEARFADAVAQHLRGLGVTRPEEIANPHTAPVADFSVVFELTMALVLVDRLDEAELVVNAMEQLDTLSIVRHHHPTLRSVITAERGDAEAAVELLREALAAERRTFSPFLATDVCVATAHVALRLDRPEVAIFVLGAVAAVGQRTTGAFGWRSLLWKELEQVADDETIAAIRSEGASYTPRDALAEAIRRLGS